MAHPALPLIPFSCNRTFTGGFFHGACLANAFNFHRTFSVCSACHTSGCCGSSAGSEGALAFATFFKAHLRTVTSGQTSYLQRLVTLIFLSYHPLGSLHVETSPGSHSSAYLRPSALLVSPALDTCSISPFLFERFCYPTKGHPPFVKLVFL